MTKNHPEVEGCATVYLVIVLDVVDESCLWLVIIYDYVVIVQDDEWFAFYALASILAVTVK